MIEEAQVTGMLGSMQALADRIGEARGKEAKAKLGMERAQDHLNKTIQERTLDLASGDGIAGAVDPRTGKSNAEWAKLLTETALHSDEDVQKSIAKFNDAQVALYEAQVTVFNLSDQLGMAKASANLLAAYMNLMGGK